MLRLRRSAQLLGQEGARGYWRARAAGEWGLTPAAEAGELIHTRRPATAGSPFSAPSPSLAAAPAPAAQTAAAAPPDARAAGGRNPRARPAPRGTAPPKTSCKVQGATTGSRVRCKAVRNQTRAYCPLAAGSNLNRWPCNGRIGRHPRSCARIRTCRGAAGAPPLRCASAPPPRHPGWTCRGSGGQ